MIDRILMIIINILCISITIIYFEILKAGIAEEEITGLKLIIAAAMAIIMAGFTGMVLGITVVTVQ